MNVELCPAPEFTINLQLRMKVQVLDLYGIHTELSKTIRCVDPGASAHVRLVSIPGADTYEWQLQLGNTVYDPQELLDRVRARAQIFSSSDEKFLARGKTRNVRNSVPPVPTVMPKLF